ALQPLHAAVEVAHGDAVGDHRVELELAVLEQRLHLVPGLVHQAAIDALHGSAFENEIFREVQLYWLGGNAEQRDAPAQSQNIKPQADARGFAANLQNNIYAYPAGG